MDEFIFYNKLACFFRPFSIVDEACSVFDLNFLNTGLILPLRTYHYAGSFPSFYYLPLFLLWKSPLSARFLGYLFLLGGGVILARMFRVSLKHIIIALLLLFPYAFQHLVDTGPIGFHILSVYIYVFLLERWTRTLRWRYVLAIATMLFLGIWIKLSYFWFLPAFGILLAISFAENPWLLKHAIHRCRVLIQGGVALLLASTAVGVLLMSTDPHNPQRMPLWEEIRQSEVRSVRELVRGEWMLSGIVAALQNPMEATQRVYDVAPRGFTAGIYSVLLYGVVPFGLLLAFLLRLPLHPVRRRWSLYYYCAFLLTVAMVTRTRGAWAMHHAILTYPFLILALLSLIAAYREGGEGRWKWYAARSWSVIFGCFLILNVLFYIRTPFQHVHATEHPSKQVIHAILQRPDIARKYIAVVVDWGMYYINGPYGDREQMVLWWWGMRHEDQVQSLREIAQQYGRKVLFVYMQENTAADIPLIQRSFSLIPCHATIPSDPWQMVAEYDPILLRECQVVGAHVAARRQFLASVLPLQAIGL